HRINLSADEVAHIACWNGTPCFPPNDISCRLMSLAPTLCPMAVTFIEIAVSGSEQHSGMLGWSALPLCGSPPKASILSRIPTMHTISKHSLQGSGNHEFRSIHSNAAR
ncbi:hypothetical protein T310_8678, partial [Rasamsonia emersonii CBS 393.64]